MSEPYAREILRRNVAQICQTIGWNGINSTPLDILTHLLEKYIRTLGTQTNRYAEQFNRTEPNLHDLGLVFGDLNVELPDLSDYTRSVPSVPLPMYVARFPKAKESNLNFLKPGSHEVVTRPMHVHEHLPPMHPEKEQEMPVSGTVEVCQNGIKNVDNNNATCKSPEISVTDSPDKPKDVFKRPIDPVVLPNSKRPRLRVEEEERTREISSVMMTMSGFLSPAREGKLPEARPPTVIAEKHYDKHKTNSNHSNAAKLPVTEKSDKKSKKNKILNGKIMKNKRKDKTHKGESSKLKDGSKLSKYPPGHLMKSKEIHQMHNHSILPAPKVLSTPPKSVIPPPPVTIPETIRPVIKQEPIGLPQPVTKTTMSGEEAIPVPRKIPIGKSPLVFNPVPPVHKNQPIANSLMPDTEIKKETIDVEEKLTSQPDRSKINIFKRISNKSKEEKSVPEVVPEKPQSDTISKLQNTLNDNSLVDKTNESIQENVREAIVNNNDTSAVDLSKEMDLRAHEVISIDDDSLDMNPIPKKETLQLDVTSSTPFNKTLQTLTYPKDNVARVSPRVCPKIKKEKKHKDKKDKAAKLEAKLLKKQQQQLAHEMARANKQNLKISNTKRQKSNRQKNEPKISQVPAGFPYFPGMAPSRNMMHAPGLIPNPGLLASSDFLAGLANNPALRGLPSSNLLTNPFALTGSGPGLIPGPGFLTGALSSGISNPLMNLGNFPHTSRSSSIKIPPMLRRPSLEVIPVDNDDERGIHKSLVRDKDRHDKHKSPTIPNILQKHKSKYKDHKSNIFKMPPVQPDITIELNPPKLVDPVKLEPPTPPPILVQSPTPEPLQQPKSESPTIPSITLTQDVPEDKKIETLEKKKDKSHKKEKKDKDGIKIKKKKDKKDKNKNKSEKKRVKEQRQEMKEKIKKEKKDKKKAKTGKGLVPKITLKLSSSNSNSPMPPSSPDKFKLNIKPIVKKEAEESLPVKEDPVSRDQSRSPELAQISALVTRPPKQKHSKHNHVVDVEAQSSPPPSVSSPPRKNRPPSGHSKYKRILFKPLSKKGHFEEDMASMADEPMAPPSESTDKPSGPLPTPYYLDEQGNKVWVCPACGRPDNGSPMIGCDGCDGWYHWVCVGITEEPGATEDWFCKSCLAKRTAMVLAGVTSVKKRGRKPKTEKTRDCH